MKCCIDVGLKNLAICIMELNNSEYKIHLWDVFDVINENTKINSFLLHDIAKKIVIKIQEIYDNNIEIFKKLDSVFIELQPKINSRMTFASHVIFTKFTDLYKHNQQLKIRFVSASQKLKAYTGPKIHCKLKSKYAARKWLSIQYCKWILENKIFN